MSAMTSRATSLGFLLLTGNSIIAVRKSQGDAAAIIFIVVSYASLLLLFCCLRRYETAPPESVARHRAKVGVWLLTALLTTIFSWRVSSSMPWPVSVGVWLMAASTVAAGFYTLFLLPGGD